MDVAAAASGDEQTAGRKRDTRQRSKTQIWIKGCVGRRRVAGGAPLSGRSILARREQGVPVGREYDALDGRPVAAKPRISSRDWTSHSRTVLSAPALASVEPSGLKATSFTGPTWPLSTSKTGGCNS